MIEDESSGEREATESTDDRIERIPIDTRAADEDDGDGDADEGGIFGPEANSTPVEAGSPTLEHALFVVLGALGMVLVFVRLVQVTLGV